MNTEKAELLEEYGHWLSFVAELARYDEKLWNQKIAPGKWSFREVVAHISQWDDYFYEEAISKLGTGMLLTVKHLDYDEFNEGAKAYGKITSIEELASGALKSRVRIIDAIAELTNEQYEAIYTDGDGHPFSTAQYLKDFIWHDQHHIGQIKNRLHFRIEELSLNGWPSLQTLVYDGWLLRFNEGYTKRSNSIQAIYGNTLALEDKLSKCEQWYEGLGSQTIFKITPFIQPVMLDEELASRGYEQVDRTLVKTMHLDQLQSPSPADIWFEEELSETWLDVVTMFNKLSETQREITRKMLEQRSPLQRCFAILHQNGIPVACGLAVIEDGWIGLYDIVTDPEKRNLGFGTQLISHILDWGKSKGAKQAYLLVVKDNAPANRLYEKIGYVEQYEYWYRVQA